MSIRSWKFESATAWQQLIFQMYEPAILSLNVLLKHSECRFSHQSSWTAIQQAVWSCWCQLTWFHQSDWDAFVIFFFSPVYSTRNSVPEEDFLGIYWYNLCLHKLMCRECHPQGLLTCWYLPHLPVWCRYNPAEEAVQPGGQREYGASNYDNFPLVLSVL